MGETANGRNGEAHIRAAGARRFMRPGERIGLMRCLRLARSPVRPFAVSPIRLAPPGSWILAPFVAGPPTLSDNINLRATVR
jgi:hypothetical protein